MIKKIVVALFMICVHYSTVAQNAFSWDLDQYHDYSTFVTLKYTSKGVSLGDDFGSGVARNLSGSSISLTLEFIITDFCGNSTSQYWPGGLDLKPGETESFPFAIPIKCKELRKDGAKSTGIASVTCQVLSFRNLTEEANKLKEEKERKERELEEARRKREKELAEKKQAEEEKAAADKKAKAEKETQMKAEADRKAAEEKEAQTKKDEERAKQEQTDKEKELQDEGTANEKKEADKKAADKKAADKKAAEKKTVSEEEQKAKWERNVAASKFEADADELVYSDASAAKRLYEQAQSINYTSRVEEKIKNLKTNLQAQAGVQAIMGVDKLTDDLDPNGKTRFSEVFSGYDGLVPNNEKLNQQYKHQPWQLHFFGLRMSALFLAVELRLGYFNSPYYQFEVRNTKDVDRNIDNVAIQQQAITTGLSAGLNFPFKNFCLYGLYGAEWVGIVTAKTMEEGKGYSFDDDDYAPKFPDFIFVLSTGIDYRIPKTRLGIGVRYNMNKVLIKPFDANIKINGGADSRYQYFMNRISPEKMEYTNLGFRLIWEWD